MNSSEVLAEPLKIEADPFARSGATYLSAPLRAAFREMIPLAVSRTPLVAVTGAASTGKTLLASLTARTCSEMGLSVRHAERPDLAGVSLDGRTDVLLFDEADGIADSTLERLLAKDRGCATTTILFGLPTLSLRLAQAGAHPVGIELAPFSREDSRNYLLALAAAARMPNLFEPEALDGIVDGIGSSPRLLRSTASLAYFFAASAGASNISAKYAASALGARIAEGFPKFTKGPVARQAANESPVAPAQSESVVVMPADAKGARNPEAPDETSGAGESGELPSDSENAGAWQLPRFPQHPATESPTQAYDMAHDGSAPRRTRTVISGLLIVVAAAILGWSFAAILNERGPGADSVVLNGSARNETSGLSTVPAPAYNAGPADGAASTVGPNDGPALRDDNAGAADRSGSETVVANPAPAPPDVAHTAPPDLAPPPAAPPPKQAAGAPEPVTSNRSRKPTVDQTLTAEERAAVSRGLRELERDDLR